MQLEEYKNPNDKTTYMETLSACMNKVAKDGYTEEFKLIDMQLICLSSNTGYAPGDITVPNFYRFEGSSDPDDEAILYLIETTDGAKGTLVDAYGTYGDDGIDAFFKQVTDINKRVDKKNK